MTEAAIECFLAIYRHKTVSNAAASLYVTQSSLSIRLKTLESELGGALFIRKKGSREMIPTPAGEKLYKLALQYKELLLQIQTVCHTRPTALRVSAINSLGTFFLPEVYERFLQNGEGYTLEIQDMERENAESSICTGLTDLAFTSGKTNDPRLQQTPIFSEPMVLICPSGLSLPAKVTLQSLQRYKEAYVEWSRSFAHWHQENFPQVPQITVSIMAQLEQFMKKGDYWAIVPISVAEGLAKTCGVQITETDFTPPHREISVLTMAEQSNEAVAHFLTCLHATIAHRKNLHSLI